MRQTLPLWLFLLPLAAVAGTPADSVSTPRDSVAPPSHALKNVVVRAAKGGRLSLRTENVEWIGQGQLKRAACCNLGESFTTNPSVDVSYPDAATGARQIKLLGLSGVYVQMLTENVPTLRGAAFPYSLSFVPGPWMQSIQVSKGAADVKNGYESTTGQINVEFLKPQATEGVRGNLYFDSQTKLDANADANVHLSDKLSTSLLLHFENRQKEHDGDGDGFADMPRLRQYNVMNRWAYLSSGFLSQLAVRLLRDERESGQVRHGHSSLSQPLYRTDGKTDRYEAWWKNALLFQGEGNASLALILHGSWHDAAYRFGLNRYDVTQKNGYASLLYETDLTPRHNLSVGVSVNYDRYDEKVSDNLPRPSLSEETTAGFYARYTFRPTESLTLMPGLRWDASDRYGSFLTPRLHVKYAPTSSFSLRASAGKGYRSPHPLAENAPLLASGRTVAIASSRLRQEEAWNYGLSASMSVPVGGRKMELNAEYYYTRFLSQLVVNTDGAAGPHTLVFENLKGRSYSHTWQVDATYPFSQNISATAAFRVNDARTTYDGRLRRRPLTPSYKGLLTLSCKTPLNLWHFDLTGHLNGEGRLYDGSSYPAFVWVQAQVTREFRHFDLYAGGENLTNYRIKHAIASADRPWDASFDATRTWGPTEGTMAYIGVRFKWEKQ